MQADARHLSGLLQIAIMQRVYARDMPSQDRESDEHASPGDASSLHVRPAEHEADAPLTSTATAQTRIASFGPFRLHITERFLEKHQQPVKIGSRALDILIALVESAPELVPKRELN